MENGKGKRVRSSAWTRSRLDPWEMTARILKSVDGLFPGRQVDFRWTMVGSEPAIGKPAIREWMAKAPPEPPSVTVETMVAEGASAA